MAAGIARVATDEDVRARLIAAGTEHVPRTHLGVGRGGAHVALWRSSAMTAPSVGADGALRVSIDLTAVPVEPVGAGATRWTWPRALARRDDVSLTAWCRRDDGARWSALAGSTPAAVRRRRRPRRRPSRLVWEQLRLPKLVDDADVDVHHGPHYTMPERTAVPCVVTVHDLTFFDHPEWHERSKVRVFRRAIRDRGRVAPRPWCA